MHKATTIAAPLLGALLLLFGCGDFDSFDRRSDRQAGTDPNSRQIVIVDEGSDAGSAPSPNPSAPAQPDGWVPAQPDGGATPQPDTVPPPAPDSCGHNPIEQQVFLLLNQERQQRGLKPYTCDPFAVIAARGHSQYMCNTKLFSHYVNGTPSTRLTAAGATFEDCGENIAWGYMTPQEVHDGWMGSWGHRAAMLSTSFERVGVGYVLCNGTTPYWTENFLR